MWSCTPLHLLVLSLTSIDLSFVSRTSKVRSSWRAILLSPFRGAVLNDSWLDHPFQVMKFTVRRYFGILINSFTWFLSCCMELEDLIVNVLLRRKIVIKLTRGCVEIVTCPRDCVDLSDLVEEYCMLLWYLEAYIYLKTLFPWFPTLTQRRGVTQRVKWGKRSSLPVAIPSAMLPIYLVASYNVVLSLKLMQVCSRGGF